MTSGQVLAPLSARAEERPLLRLEPIGAGKFGTMFLSQGQRRPSRSAGRWNAHYGPTKKPQQYPMPRKRELVEGESTARESTLGGGALPAVPGPSLLAQCR